MLFNVFLLQTDHVAKIAEANWQLAQYPNMPGQLRKHTIDHFALADQWEGELVTTPPRPPYKRVGRIGVTSVNCGCCEPLPKKEPELGTTPVSVRAALKLLQNGAVVLCKLSFNRHMDSVHKKKV